jgi:hypothetical protein
MNGKESRLTLRTDEAELEGSSCLEEGQVVPVRDILAVAADAGGAAGGADDRSAVVGEAGAHWEGSLSGVLAEGEIAGSEGSGVRWGQGWALGEVVAGEVALGILDLDPKALDRDHAGLPPAVGQCLIFVALARLPDAP